MQVQRQRTLVESLDGSVLAIDARRQFVKPFILLTNQPNNVVPMAANQASTFYTLTVAGSGPIEIGGLSAQRTGPCLLALMVQDGRSSRYIMNNQIHIDTLCGNGQLPYVLPETLLIDELRNLLVSFTDISGQTNSARIALHGARHLGIVHDPRLVLLRARTDLRQHLSLPFFYTFETGGVTVGAGATVQAAINISPDHHFEIHTITAVSDYPFDLDIVDVARAESLVSGPNGVNFPVASALVCGTPQYPFKFHEPYLVLAGQRLLVTLVNRDAQHENNVYLTLGGRALVGRPWKH
jgi:hypothetical protein